MKALLAVAAVAAALVLAACGGGSSDEDYSAALNDACNDLQTKQAGASVAAKEQGTSASDLSAQYNEEFRQQVEDLEPPSDLEDGDAELREALDSAPEGGVDPTDVESYFGNLGDIYTDLGADDCAAQQEIIIKTYGKLKGGLFETGQSG